MTRAQVRRLSGRLVDIERELGKPEGWTGEPAVVLGASRLYVLVGWDWSVGIGWPLDGHGSDVFDGFQGCGRAWWCLFDVLDDLLPPGAAVARGAR